MLGNIWKHVIIIALSCCSMTIRCHFYECHDDASFDPEEGPVNELQFTWLGTLQYIHIKEGTPHYFRVPRVILISSQFTLCMAADAARVPEYCALGNVAFADYERDEIECGLSINDVTLGAHCEPAIMIMPIADVLLHPEYKHFGAQNSVALLKMITPLKSKYMVPACLPFQNLLVDSKGKQIGDTLIHVDFSADSPRDFGGEEKEVAKITLVLCQMYDDANRRHAHHSSKIPKVRMLCTTGCGLRSGAPTMIHEPTGHWTLVALSTGGSSCPDPLRVVDPSSPPHHLTIYPYVPWITSAVTGLRIGAFAKDDPFGYVVGGSYAREPRHNWVGHWWMAGDRCLDRVYDKRSGDETYYQPFRFYHETFTIRPHQQTHLAYYLEIQAPYFANIICVKINMPHTFVEPTAWELGSPVVRVRIPLIKFKDTFGFQVEAWGQNISDWSSLDLGNRQ